MKLRIILLCASAFPLLATEPERVLPGSHISLSAQLVANAAKATDRYRDSYGGHITDTKRERRITADVRNFGAQDAEIDLTVLWIGKSTYTGKRMVLGTAVHSVSVARGAQKHIASSAEIEAHEMHLNLIGVQRDRGATLEGWVVTARLRAAGAPPPAQGVVISAIPPKIDNAGQVLPNGALVSISSSDTHLSDWVRAGCKEE